MNKSFKSNMSEGKNIKNKIDILHNKNELFTSRFVNKHKYIYF